jgi:hypothetical protein
VLREAFDVAAGGSDQIMFLLVLDEDATTPSKVTRDARGALFAENADRLAAWAACVRGKGLAGNIQADDDAADHGAGGVRCR